MLAAKPPESSVEAASKSSSSPSGVKAVRMVVVVAGRHHRRDHALLAVEQQLDRPPRRVGEERADGLDDVLGLAAERPAHGHLDHAHAVVLEVQQLGDDGARRVHALAGGPDGHAAGAVALGDAHVRLERRVVDARRARRGRHGDGALEVRALAPLDLVLVQEVAALVDGRRAVGERRVHGEQRRQLLVLDLDERRGRLGGRLARRHDRGHPVADEPDVLAEQRLVVERHVLAGVDARAGERLHGGVLVREDLDDARERLGAGGVDPLDHAVRDAAEDELGVEHARHAEVAAVDELPRHLLGHVVDGVAAPDVLQVLDQADGLLSAPVARVRSGCPEDGPPDGSRRTSAGTRPCGPAPPAPYSTRPRWCT